tara:strand:- start:1778 stop:2038 length:261 start_codon:yes stop_codon:yes gene_type:complete
MRKNFGKADINYFLTDEERKNFRKVRINGQDAPPYGDYRNWYDVAIWRMNYYFDPNGSFYPDGYKPKPDPMHSHYFDYLLDEEAYG